MRTVRKICFCNVQGGWLIGLVLLSLLVACADTEGDGLRATSLSQTRVVSLPSATSTGGPGKPTPESGRATATAEARPAEETPQPVSGLPEREVFDVAGFVERPVAMISGEALWFLAESSEAAGVVPLGSSDSALATTLVRSPDGRRLAWLVVSAEERALAQQERRNVRRVYPAVLDLATGELRRYLEVVVDRQSGLAWAADGARLYFKGYSDDPAGQGTLHSLVVATGEVEVLFAVGEQYEVVAGDFALLPGNELLFALMEAGDSGRESGRVHLAGLDLDNGAVRVVASVVDAVSWPEGGWENFFVPLRLNGEGTVAAMVINQQLDPDMRRMEAQGLYLLEVGGGEPEPVILEAGLGAPAWSPEGRYVAVAGGVAESSGLWIRDLERGVTTALAEEQFLAIREMVNPEERPLSFLSLGPVAWLNGEALVLQVSFAFTEEVTAIERLLVVLNMETGEIMVNN